MTTVRDPLGDLQAWYLAHCDGDWEHSNGVSISTLDNPGWRVEIALSETDLERRPFDRLEDNRTADDWIVCWKDQASFRCACGPLNLAEALTIFLGWAT